MTELSPVDRAAGIGRSTQSAVYRAGASGGRPAVPTRWSDLSAAAERAMSAEFDLALGLAGYRSPAELSRETLA